MVYPWPTFHSADRSGTAERSESGGGGWWGGGLKSSGSRKNGGLRACPHNYFKEAPFSIRAEALLSSIDSTVLRL